MLYVSTSFRVAVMVAVSAALLFGTHLPELLRVCSFHLSVFSQIGFQSCDCQFIIYRPVMYSVLDDLSAFLLRFS